jgi:hypothetical protein
MHSNQIRFDIVTGPPNRYSFSFHFPSHIQYYISHRLRNEIRNSINGNTSKRIFFKFFNK